MTKEKKVIVDEVLKKFKYNEHFETEHFIYWVKSSFTYDGESVDRDVYIAASDYAIKHGELPSCNLKERLFNSRGLQEDYVNTKDSLGLYTKKRNVTTNTYSSEVILRYSKTYDSLELYGVKSDIKSPVTRKSERVLCMKKRVKFFSINSNGFVLISGRRWLSLKNWGSISFDDNTVYKLFTDKLIKKLIQLNIRTEWIKSLPVENIVISNKNARSSSSLFEAIEKECGIKVVKTIGMAFGDNANSIIGLHKIIDSNYIHKITNFIKENRVILKKIFKPGDPGSYKVILYFYFLVKDNRLEKDLFFDYINMLEEEGLKINLNISSYNTIRKNHDRLSEEILKKANSSTKLKIDKVFPVIESSKNINFELIKSVARLNTESVILHHCVHSYKDRVSRGQSAIYSIVYNNSRYTLELSVDEVGEKKIVYANQLRGLYNSLAPIEIKEELIEVLDNNGVEFNDKIVSFQKNEFKSRSIAENESFKQIGAAILDKENSFRMEEIPF